MVSVSPLNEEHRLAYAVTHVPGVHQHRDWVVERQRDHIAVDEYVTDPERLGVWPTTRVAWWRLALRHEDATHALVLQDDMSLCRGFETILSAAIAARPEHAIQLFTRANFLRNAHEEGDTWATSADLVWGGSTVLPMAWVEPFLRDVDRAFPADYPHDDVRLGWWLWKEGIRLWHTVPCLVEHVEPGRSLLGQSNRTRVAAVFEDRPGPVDFETIPEKPLHYGRSRTRGIEEVVGAPRV